MMGGKCDSGSKYGYFWVQDGPLAVANGVVTPMNGLYQWVTGVVAPTIDGGITLLITGVNLS